MRAEGDEAADHVEGEERGRRDEDESEEESSRGGVENVCGMWVRVTGWVIVTWLGGANFFKST